MEPQSNQESNRKPISQRILAGATLNSRVWKISVTEAYNVLDKSKTGYLPLSHKFFRLVFFSTPHWLPHLKQVHLLFFNRSVRDNSLHILVVQTFSFFSWLNCHYNFLLAPPCEAFLRSFWRCLWKLRRGGGHLEQYRHDCTIYDMNRLINLILR